MDCQIAAKTNWHPGGSDCRQIEMAPCPPFRQWTEMAEGQKSADVKHISRLPPPSARQEKWRKGSKSSRNIRFFMPADPLLAEGVMENSEQYWQMLLTVATGA
jgi:hypothetical protein